ncbi:MAG: DUF1849 family protein [Alphaproteobacteria bacterium]|jgi:hypothetical protein|nr:DUF1849 family protein [Alphaproteobacteria bacterium]MBT4082285.1 DUF1849 family protein [Alphaproteobacteria bacterium]MBT4542814.1 DUF1849 family protein [Alphaproteobacteria bacterium]MBT7744206.1 DUF1849 family protein [Alphaproteobacteria bacterium]
MQKTLISGLTLIGTIFVLLSPNTAAAFKLLSHRAVYDLSLAPGDNGKISRADGRLVLEWADTCDGYTTEQRMLMLLDIEDGVVRSDYQFSSWESKDGDQFRYDVKTVFGNLEPEVFRGRANRNKGTGLATFTKPANLKLKLPKKIVFPSEHMALLIDQAAKGERQISMPMFDGTGEGGLFEAVAFVLGKAPEKPVDLLASYADTPGWRVQLSFFDLNNLDQLPTYKVNFTIYSNGVAGDVVMDYSDFAVHGKLSDFKVLPSTGC